MAGENVLVKELVCPECHKEKAFSYSESGVYSSRCEKCKKYIMWDFTNMVARKVSATKRK